MLHENVTKVVIGAFYAVYNDLGYGFLEKVYENALTHKLGTLGLSVRQQAPIKVYYEGKLVGEYYADLLVESCTIVELKTLDRIEPPHTAQLLNYLKATEIEVGLLLNFGPEPQIKRQILTNDRKKWKRNQPE
jgi:GxxExxY protein